MENSFSSTPFLSATPSGTFGVPQSGVHAAIKGASARTGVSFEFLLETARRESSLNPQANAKTSSAAGLFQFIEQTWLGAVHQFGDKYGLGSEASAIERGLDGKFTVADKKIREHILDLRYSAEKASALAAELTAHQRDQLEMKLGKSVGSGALYAAHFLGLGGAVKLLSSKGDVAAASLFPKAAQANQAIFYEGTRPKTVAEIISSFEASFSSQKQNRPEGIEGEISPALPRVATFPENPISTFQAETGRAQLPPFSTQGPLPLPGLLPGPISVLGEVAAFEEAEIVHRDKTSGTTRVSKLSVLNSRMNTGISVNLAQHLSPTVMQVLLSLNPGTLLRNQK